MGKSKETFGKKEREKKRLKKRKEKQLRKEERKAYAEKNKDNDDYMIAYVDEFGNLTDTPPDPKKKIKVDHKTIRVSTPSKVELEEDDRLEGRVDYFNQDKGFGFIRGSGNNEKYFVHVKGLLMEVKEGDLVSFEPQQGIKGMNAVEVRRI
ncbi:MAG: cold shock domain-containing protein [Bacteroidetes bacterium]|nr:cold shock domain-containing protein [Bacteroidota bacterium]